MNKFKVTEKAFNDAQDIIRRYSEQKDHLIRDDIENDCPSEDYEIGKPNGECETDGHYMCMDCKHCDPKLTPISMDDIDHDYEFLNYDEVEERWNHVKVVGLINGLTDIENIDYDSEHMENVWSVTDGEITNINNSKKL